MIQHDMMMLDHGMPRADGTLSPEQRPEADFNIEWQSNSKMAEASMKLALVVKLAADKYSTDYPATLGPHMTNTDSGPFQDIIPAISLRENERGDAHRRRLESALAPGDGSVLDVFGQGLPARTERRAGDAVGNRAADRRDDQEISGSAGLETCRTGERSMRSKILAGTAACMTMVVALAAQQPQPEQQAPPSRPPVDDIGTLVGRLELEKYKATLKGLTQFGDRRQGTQRNRDAVNWIQKQLESYGYTNAERITYDPPVPTRECGPSVPASVVQPAPQRQGGAGGGGAAGAAGAGRRPEPQVAPVRGQAAVAEAAATRAAGSRRAQAAAVSSATAFPRA